MDLAEIHAYISKDSVDNASQMIGRILDAVESIKIAPHHKIVSGIKSPRPLRSLPVKPYVVYYEVLDADRVILLHRVRHGSRRPPTDFD
jgi:plasmid stabilization system protein ParE